MPKRRRSTGKRPSNCDRMSLPSPTEPPVLLLCRAVGFINEEMRTAIFLLLTTLASVVAAATRPPAVAGAFYTDDPDELRRQVTLMLGEAPDRPPSKAMVVPHAGFVFSGEVAGEAFATLEHKAVHRVILLGPSHHEAFTGGALPARNIDSFSTPLGDVDLDEQALRSLRGLPVFRGPASAHGPEHCLEVELPFLQVAAPEAKIVPILVGAGDRPRDSQSNGSRPGAATR